MFEFFWLPFLLVSTSALSCDGSVCLCSGDTCSSCLLSFQYLEGNVCQPCPYMCKSCSSGTLCSKCYASFFLEGGTCTLCPSNCETCGAGQVCSSCLVHLPWCRQATTSRRGYASSVLRITWRLVTLETWWWAVWRAIGKMATVVLLAVSFAWFVPALPTACSARRAIMWPLVLAATVRSALLAARPALLPAALNASWTMSSKTGGAPASLPTVPPSPIAISAPQATTQPLAIPANTPTSSRGEFAERGARWSVPLEQWDPCTTSAWMGVGVMAM